jgi:hypothetical protein
MTERSALLTSNVVAILMGPVAVFIADKAGMEYNGLLSLALATPMLCALFLGIIVQAIDEGGGFDE